MFIYKITNLINNKIYIGKTKQSITRRWAQHKSRAKLKKFVHGPKLYKDMHDFGICNFSCEVLHSCKTSQEMDELELYYIRNFDSVENGYNIIYGDLFKRNVLYDSEIFLMDNVISLGLKSYWKSKSPKERSEMAYKTMHSISSEQRSSNNKKMWDSLDKDTRNNRIQKTSQKHKSAIKQKVGIYTFIDPNGIIYENIDNVTNFAKEHNLKRNCLYHLIKGNSKAYKGWKVIIVRKTKISNKKSYKLKSPTGEIIEIFNLSKFCRDNSLSYSSFTCMLRGVCKQHKGWKLL